MQLRRFGKSLAAPLTLVLLALVAARPALARPEYFARYRANPFSRPDLKTCGVCHENPQGGGPRNDFGVAFANAGRQFTPELRAKFPDRFLQDRANLAGGVEIVFEQGGGMLVRQGRTSYRVNPATRDVVKLDDAATPGGASTTAAAPAPEAGRSSPVFDYQLVNLRTGKIAQKGEFNFRFSHRFTSDIFNQSQRPFDLFGLDTFSYTGLGVSYGIHKRFAVNVYRQVWDRKLEFSGDVAVADQGESRSPVTVLARAAIDGKKDFASGGHGGHYTPSLQFVVQRTFANRFSINVDPTFVFRTRGLSTRATEDHLIALGVGGSIKLRESMAIVGEVIPHLTTNPLENDIFHSEPTASFGFQFRTHRHVFEIVFSNGWETNIAGSALGGPDGKHIGFNIYRRIK
jgi:hypothetical protein